MAAANINRKSENPLWDTWQEALQDYEAHMSRQKQQQSAGEPAAGDKVEHQKPKTPHSADGKSRKFRMPGQKKPESITRIQWKNRKAVQRLSVLWPELFDLNNPKPLKLGVLNDLVRDTEARGLGVGKGSLKASLVSYTRSFRYLRR
ncbi:TPA: hypothetical protein G8O67_004766 [Salmonella enterica]|uniref:ProQ/FinO domain-containing protein n=1 Tax=Salmonella enterica TaxID=28901 RepID=A0A756I659_SALER|nr:hypothetical protein [Salmonella enterica]